MMIPDWAKELGRNITVCVIVKEGEVARLCEIPMVIPAQLPHYERE